MVDVVLLPHDISLEDLGGVLAVLLNVVDDADAVLAHQVLHVAQRLSPCVRFCVYSVVD